MESFQKPIGETERSPLYRGHGGVGCTYSGNTFSYMEEISVVRLKYGIKDLGFPDQCKNGCSIGCQRNNTGEMEVLLKTLSYTGHPPSPERTRTKHKGKGSKTKCPYTSY